MCNVHGEAVSETAEFSLGCRGKQERFYNGSLHRLDEENAVFLADFHVSAFTVPRHDGSGVAELHEFVGQVVDVGACAAGKRQVLRRQKAHANHAYRLPPARNLTVVMTAPVNHASDLTK